MLFNATPAAIDKELKAASKEKEKIEKGIEKIIRSYVRRHYNKRVISPHVKYKLFKIK